ncbi:MAG TPA: condensation domain-containing protein, partial [Pseudonocardiaceae bacterium]|nr:condensation domain-containing protein [Pseudonocardiaceae bacterium]
MTDSMPLSPAQRRLWFLDRLGDAGTAYNVPYALTITGELDTDALAAAFVDVVTRHETLRTVFPMAGEQPCQRVLDTVPSVLRRTGPATTEDVVAAARHHFDLAAEPPIRATLCRQGPAEHLLVLVIHHVAVDGLSMRPLLDDLATAYAARTGGMAPDWEPLPVQYGDYTLWQRELLGDESDEDSVAGRDLDYWRTTLAGLPEELPLPLDRPRPPVFGHIASAVPVHIGAEVRRRLAELGRAERCSVFMLVQAALAATLTRLGAGTDVPIGSPVGGRSDEGLDELVGLFVNTVVLRGDTSGNPTFRELLARVHTLDLDAYEHGELPIDRVLEAVNPARSLARNPLFQVCLAVAGPRPRLALPGVDCGVVELVPNGTCKFDLELLLYEETDGIVGNLLYNAEVFDPATAGRLVGALYLLLDQVAADPDAHIADIEVSSAADRAALAEWAGRTVDVPDLTLAELFARAVASTPAATAVVFGGDRLSYAELDERATRLAGQLVAVGVRRGDVVGVLFERGIEFAVAVVAVVRAGAGYTLLDPEFPDQRLAGVLADIDVRVVVSAAALAHRLSGVTVVIDSGATVDVALPVAVPGDVACVMFTSGSTGRPKGVLAPHRALVGTLLGQEYANFGPGEVFVQCSPVSWDAFSLEFWGALGFGGTCVLHPGQRPEPAILAGLVAKHGVTMVQVSSSLFNFLVDEVPGAFAGVRLAFTGGEAASAAHVTRALKAFPELTVVNGYGPAESMGFTTTHVVPAGLT